MSSVYSEEKGRKTKRLALVIGNSEYQNLSYIPHSENDANAVYITLESLKFEVYRGINLQRIEILELLTKHLESWGNEASEIVVYYSGHANLIEGKVYIGPVDVYESLPMTFIKQSLLDVDVIISTLLEYRENDKIPIVIILDCCHSELESGTTTHDQENENPLQSIDKANIAVLYSTAEDIGLLEYKDQYKRSPYTEALLENMEKDWSIVQVHEAAAKQIEKLRGKQMSWIYNSLYEPYKFSQQRSILTIQESSTISLESDN